MPGLHLAARVVGAAKAVVANDNIMVVKSMTVVVVVVVDG